MDRKFPTNCVFYTAQSQVPTQSSIAQPTKRGMRSPIVLKKFAKFLWHKNNVKCTHKNVFKINIFYQKWRSISVSWCSLVCIYHSIPHYFAIDDAYTGQYACLITSQKNTPTTPNKCRCEIPHVSQKKTKWRARSVGLENKFLPKYICNISNKSI